jgi:tRNA threonylcarbamoyladenosine biosynthesis protein TsaB
MDGIILAIETSGELGGAALLKDGEVLAHADVSGPRRHGAELMPCIDKVCKEADIKRTDIDIIAVNRGPGSYTGLRIGMSAAAAIGYALDKPVVGVRGFEAMALRFVLEPEFDTSQPAELWPVLDARRDEVMTARFTQTDGDIRAETEELLVSPAELHAQAAKGAWVFGTGVKPYADLFNREHLQVTGDDFEPTASAVGLQAYRQLAEVDDPGQIDRNPPTPIYFRRVLAKTIKERQAGN